MMLLQIIDIILIDNIKIVIYGMNNVGHGRRYKKMH